MAQESRPNPRGEKEDSNIYEELLTRMEAHSDELIVARKATKPPADYP